MSPSVLNTYPPKVTIELTKNLRLTKTNVKRNKDIVQQLMPKCKCRL